MLEKQAESKVSQLNIERTIDSDMKTKKVIINPDDYPKSMKLGVRLRIEQLTAIDTVSQSYRARMIQVTDWPATDDDIKHFENDEENFCPSRIAKPLWLNCKSSEVVYQVYSQFENKEDGKRYNLRLVYLNCEFTEEFECNNFPFDVQDLSFILDCDMGINRLILVPSRYKPDLLYINTSFLALCDWEIVYSVCVKKICTF